MSENDVIKMSTDTQLTDKQGNPINIKTPQPEYLVETFSLKESNNRSVVTTKDE